MIKLLTKIFIHDSENVSSPAVRRAYGTMCGCFGIFLNLLLFAGKYIAGIVSGSVAITADAFNNLSDAGSSVITLIGFALAGKKPDPDHPFGHGRIEYLSGLILSAVIIVMGFELGKSSFEKILHPEEVTVGLLPAVILLVSILVKLYMSIYNRAVGRKIDSAAMQATSADSLSDSVATSVVLLTMGVTYFFHINIDGYAGMAVALFIIYAGINAAKDTISPLLGQAPDSELVAGIEQTVLTHPEIVGIHDLLVHDYGPGRLMISLHAEVDGSGDVFLLHDAIDNAEHELKEKFGCIATIHLDPIDLNNDYVNRLRSEITEELCKIDEGVSVHDLRIVPGPTHTNVIFDAVFPVWDTRTDEQLAAIIRERIHSRWDDRFAVVTVDRDYTASGSK